MDEEALGAVRCAEGSQQLSCCLVIGDWYLWGWAFSDAISSFLVDNAVKQRSLLLFLVL